MTSQAQMPLLCIGGYLDGCWRMSDQPAFCVFSPIPLPHGSDQSGDLAIAEVRVDRHDYIREGFSFTDNGSVHRMEYWRWSKLSVAECMAMLFARYKKETKL